MSDIYQEPFPSPTEQESKHGHLVEWAWRTLRYWRRMGYPELIGPPAEQVQHARQILGQLGSEAEMRIDGGKRADNYKFAVPHHIQGA